ncbi:hypothetical protein AN958_12655 [Leucoagaricus sp. SymC.cos]|nr:hypothetical protein AN958_12655 [Leucoagaricus sp. SymC.cos]
MAVLHYRFTTSQGFIMNRVTTRFSGGLDQLLTAPSLSSHSSPSALITYFGRLADNFNKLKVSGPDERTNMKSTASSGPFANAHDFVVQNPVMGETVNMIMGGNTALDRLERYIMAEAAADSSARWPPPACHPGTRKTILEMLMKWSNDPERQWKMFWLYGSAGCGKSAVAQTFAEMCIENGRLGAAFFFSRANKRHKPETVIPTIAYQLASYCLEYKAILLSLLSDKPDLLTKSSPVQFTKLIIEPFLRLRSIQQPFVILLDGLDECKGQSAQRSFVKLINDVVRDKKDLPLLWLICSRPESHLQSMFTRITDCGLEEMKIDTECITDVDRYLRDQFYELQIQYEYLTGPEWPSRDQFELISNFGEGHFIFASVVISFVGDEEYANPAERLDTLITSLERGDNDGISDAKPFSKLDALYTTVLEDIPESVFPTTWKILAWHIYSRDLVTSDLMLVSPEELCNILDLSQSAFYGALQKLHSVFYVTAPDRQDNTGYVNFRHTSFRDFLVDRSRSGRFAVEEKAALVDIAKTSLFWHELNSKFDHLAERGLYDRWSSNHRAAFLGLKWIPSRTTQIHKEISSTIACFAHQAVWDACRQTCDPDVNPDILASFLNFDHRHVELDWDWIIFVNHLYQKGCLNDFIRAEPANQADTELVEKLIVMTKGETVKAVDLPLHWGEVYSGSKCREYVLIGHGERTVLVCFTRAPGDIYARYEKLTSDSDSEHFQDQISQYQRWLEKHGWNMQPQTGRGD